MRSTSRWQDWFLAALPKSRLTFARRAMEKRDYAGAERFYAPLLDMNSDQVGVAHSEYGAILGEVAECMLAQGRTADAEGIVRRGLSETRPGRFTAELLVILARTLAAQDRWPAACGVLKQAAMVQARVTGRSSMELADMYWDAAKVCAAQPDVRRSVLYLRRARITCRENSLTKKRDRMIVLLGSQANALWSLKRFSAVVAARMRIVEMIPNKRRDRAEKAEAWESLATAQIFADNFEGALKSIDRGLEIARKLSKARRAVRDRLVELREEFTKEIPPPDAAEASVEKAMDASGEVGRPETECS